MSSKGAVASITVSSAKDIADSFISAKASAAVAAAPPSAIVEDAGGGVNLLGLADLDGALVVVDGRVKPVLLLVEVLLPVDEADEVLDVLAVGLAAAPAGVVLRERVVAGVAVLGSLGFGLLGALGGGGLN